MNVDPVWLLHPVGVYDVLRAFQFHTSSNIWPDETMMTSFKFLHAADIHLDSPLLSLILPEPTQVERVRRACRDAFEKLVDTAIELNVAFVVLAGDLYDRDVPNMQVAVFLRNQLSRLHKHNIQVAIAKGNHDADNRITSALSLPENTHVFSDKKAETIFYDHLPVRVAIHGQSFKSGPVTDNLAANYPKPVSECINIGVLHTSLAGSPEHDPYSPCKLEDLTTRGYDYWALGHIHKGATLSEDPWVVYPGNLQGRHAKETGAKGCVLVTVENERIQTVQQLDLAVVRWDVVEINLTGVAAESELFELVRAGLGRASASAEGRPIAVRVRLSGPTALFDLIEGRPNRFLQTILEVAGEVGGENLWVEKLQNEATPVEVTKEGADNASTDFDPIFAEISSSPESIANVFKAELEALRAKLPEDLRGLDAFKPLSDDVALHDALLRLKPRLRAKLAGEDEVP
jgi:DNA repair exonuclease SbcCD nuclease subunit